MQTPVPQSAPPLPWQTNSSNFDHNKRRHNSAPYVHGRTRSAVVMDGNGDPMPAQSGPDVADDDLEHAFDDECYFARRPEEIDPRFSLGLIEWKAPVLTNEPLPSTYKVNSTSVANSERPLAVSEALVP